QFPIMNTIDFEGSTDVDATSTGYRAALAWQSDGQSELMVGTDFRFINQELNEITSASFGFNSWMNRNSPLPDSNWVNPGLFIRQTSQWTDEWRTTLGARTDVVGTHVVDDPAKLAALGTLFSPQSFDYLVCTS